MSAQTSGLGFVGQSVKRVEDDRLLRGDGRYLADMIPDGCLHAAFVRSPHAHARIVSIDTTAAKGVSGVVTVGTGAEIEKLTNPFLPFAQLPGLYTPLYYALSSEKVRMVGDPVAIVVATSRHVAEDAAELVDVEYDVLPPVGTISQALDPSSAQIWERANHNLLYDQTDTFGDIDAVFARSEHVFTESFSCPRQSNQPMEPRGITVEIDPSSEEVTVRASTQSSHMLRWMIAAYTERKGGFASARAFATNRQRRAGLLAGAKQLVSDKGEALQESDNTGMVDQLKADPSMMPHLMRTLAGVAGKERYVNVVADDIGGGFGAKGSVHREDIAVAAVALTLGRSVTWVEDRVENLMDGGQAREEEMTVSIACDGDGTVRGLKVDLVIDQGAYTATPVGAPMTTRIMKVMQPGSYRFEAFEQRSRIVATNKGKYVAYRGPWANETWVRERMMNVVARKLGLDQAEIRRKNMYGAEDFAADPAPTMLTGPMLDVTMSVRNTLDRAVELADLEGFDAQRVAAAGQGRALGVGFASYHEAAPGPPDYFDHVNPGTSALIGQPTRATVEADGKVRVYTPQMPHGQSHETTYAQIAADELGVAIEDVEVVYGDTGQTPFELLGTGGSRGGPVGGGSVRKSGRALRKEIVDAAADMLEADPGDVTIVDGNIHVAGVPARGLSFSDVAAHRLGAEPNGSDVAFEVNEDYTSAGDGGWSVATHVCWVSIDLDTGKVDIPRYLVVEDCGPIINPAIVDGQVRGGVAQGIGAVLYERVAYDEEATLQSTTYLDYLIPTSMEIPPIEIEHMETLSPGENDFRGVGEGGMIGAPAALTNAIEDALGVTITEQYLPPTRILELAGVIEPD